LTPDGFSINDDGLAPDVEVEITDEDTEAERDPQLEKALELLAPAVAETEVLPIISLF
jgi:C-terminal processing protease CtpA/Prc